MHPKGHSVFTTDCPLQRILPTCLQAVHPVVFDEDLPLTSLSPSRVEPSRRFRAGASIDLVQAKPVVTVRS